MINNIVLDEFQQKIADEAYSELVSIGQCGLELMTSGGKSYIAASIIYNFIASDNSMNILWLAPKAAISNVKDKIFSKLSIDRHIEYLSYELLSRADEIPEFKSNIGLIVFDECHKAYAKQTFKMINKILEQISNVKRLAMSATPKRYNGVDTFNILVPRAKNIRFDISMAGKHNLLPDINYVLVNTEIPEIDRKIVRGLEKVCKVCDEVKNTYDEVCKMIDDFQFDFCLDFSNILKKAVPSTGESGDRHVIFFSTIKDLQSRKEEVYKAFSDAYSGCDINILEYHSKMSEEENSKAFKAFVLEEPVPNRVDVLLSVDKANESIHAENMRSVTLFRNTQSIRVYLQQIGRGIMLAKYHPEPICILDFTDMTSCIDKNKGNTSDDTVVGIKNILMQQFGYETGFEVTIGLERIVKLVEKIKVLQRYNSLLNIETSINKINKYYTYLVKNSIRKETYNIYFRINAVNEETIIGTLDIHKLYKGGQKEFSKYLDLLASNFKASQTLFLKGILNDSAKNVFYDNLNNFFESLGYSAYITRSDSENTVNMLKNVEIISNAINTGLVVGIERENRITEKLNELRLAYTTGKLPIGVSAYAKKLGLNIEGIDSIESLYKIAKNGLDSKIVSKYERIEAMIIHIRKLIRNMGSYDEQVYRLWLKMRAKLLIVHTKYKNYDTNEVCYLTLQNKNSEIINYFIISDTDINNGNLIAAILCDIENDNLLFNACENYVWDKNYSELSGYEKAILSEYNINNGFRYANRVLLRTEKGMKYLDYATKHGAESISESVKNRNEIIDAIESRNSTEEDRRRLFKKCTNKLASNRGVDEVAYEYIDSILEYNNLYIDSFVATAFKDENYNQALSILNLGSNKIDMLYNTRNASFMEFIRNNSDASTNILKKLSRIKNLKSIEDSNMLGKVIKLYMIIENFINNNDLNG